MSHKPKRDLPVIDQPPSRLAVTTMKLFLFTALWGLGACFLQAASSDLTSFSPQIFSHSGSTLYQHPDNSTQSIDLLQAFQTHYHRFEHVISSTLQNPTDSTVLARLGDDLDEFANMVTEVRAKLIVK